MGNKISSWVYLPPSSVLKLFRFFNLCSRINSHIARSYKYLRNIESGDECDIYPDDSHIHSDIHQEKTEIWIVLVLFQQWKRNNLYPDACRKSSPWCFSSSICPLSNQLFSSNFHLYFCLPTGGHIGQKTLPLG